MLVIVVSLLLGVSLTLLAQYEVALYRATRRPPSREEVDDLLKALGVWADKYDAARPRNKKRRDGELFEACTKVGLMWLRPRKEPPK